MAKGKGSLTGLYRAWSLGIITLNPEYEEHKPMVIISNTMFAVDCYC